jgi:hypothetical protein
MTAEFLTGDTLALEALDDDVSLLLTLLHAETMDDVRELLEATGDTDVADAQATFALEVRRQFDALKLEVDAYFALMTQHFANAIDAVTRATIVDDIPVETQVYLSTVGFSFDESGAIDDGWRAEVLTVLATSKENAAKAVELIQNTA